MNEHQEGDIWLPMKCLDQSQRDKETGDAAECTSAKQTHPTLPTSVQLLPTIIVDTAASASTHTSCGCVHKRTFSEIFSDFVLPIFSIITYVCDVGSDIWLAISYAQAGHWWWSGWTITFVVITAFVMAFFGFGYLADGENNPVEIDNPILFWFVWIVLTFSLTSPVLG